MRRIAGQARHRVIDRPLNGGCKLPDTRRALVEQIPARLGALAERLVAGMFQGMMKSRQLIRQRRHPVLPAVEFIRMLELNAHDEAVVIRQPLLALIAERRQMTVRYDHAAWSSGNRPRLPRAHAARRLEDRPTSRRYTAGESAGVKPAATSSSMMIDSARAVWPCAIPTSAGRPEPRRTPAARRPPIVRAQLLAVHAACIAER